MKDVTKELINQLNINNLGYDMMGYNFTYKNELSFHHLIVAKRDCKKKNLGDGYLFWNGAILVQKTSHDYLHLIENIDFEIFCQITSELIDENVKRKIERKNLERIRDLLLCFERDHDCDKNKNGNYLIKREFIEQRIPILKKEKKIWI